MDVLAVFIADDWQLSAENIFGQTLRNHPDFRVVGMCHEASLVLSEIARTKPDVAIIDLKWRKNDDGLDLITDVRAQFPAIGVVAYSSDDELLAKVKNAHERLDKMFTSIQLFDIVRRAYDAAKRPGRQDIDLTEREQIILQMMTDGMTDPEMGDALGYAPSYIRDIVDAIVTKLGARRRQHAVAIAVDRKLVRPSP